MALNSKLIGGLAWTGLVLVLAVPSADLVSSQLTPKSSLAMTADTDQVQTGSISDPVDAYVRTGKPMPSYISDAPAAVSEIPAVPAAPKPTVKIVPPTGTAGQQPVTVTVPTTPTMPASIPVETEVAAVQPIAPVPYPASMRPKAPIVTDPIVTSSVGNEETVAATTPPTGRPKAPIEQRYVTEEELAEWDSGSLAEYLESRGLIEEAAYNDGSTAGYDPDGFFLNEGPNNTNRTIRSRSRRDGEGFFFVPN